MMLSSLLNALNNQQSILTLMSLSLSAHLILVHLHPSMPKGTISGIRLTHGFRRYTWNIPEVLPGYSLYTLYSQWVTNTLHIHMSTQ